MAIRGTINVSPSPTPAFNPAPFLDPINQGIQNIAKLRMRDMERKLMEQSQIAREQRAEQRAIAASNRSHANQKDLIDFKRFLRTKFEVEMLFLFSADHCSVTFSSLQPFARDINRRS